MTTKREITRRAEEQGLTSQGFALDADAGAERRAFLGDTPNLVEQVDRARAWVRQFQRRTTLNRNAMSDVLATRASIETGQPLCHGAFLAACLLEEVMVKRVSATSRNAWTNLSFKRV